MSLSECLKELLRAGAASAYSVCKSSGGQVTAPELSRWLRGQSCLGQAKLDAVAAALGARLVAGELPANVRRRHRAERVKALTAVATAAESADRAGVGG